jgi:hypothetical protein
MASRKTFNDEKEVSFKFKFYYISNFAIVTFIAPLSWFKVLTENQIFGLCFLLIVMWGMIFYFYISRIKFPDKWYGN